MPKRCPFLGWGAFTEGRTNPRVTLQRFGLFGALTVQLLMAEAVLMALRFAELWQALRPSAAPPRGPSRSLPGLWRSGRMARCTAHQAPPKRRKESTPWQNDAPPVRDQSATGRTADGSARSSLVPPGRASPAGAPSTARPRRSSSASSPAPRWSSTAAWTPAGGSPSGSSPNSGLTTVSRKSGG